jgi:hypothetical protein
VSQKSGKSEHNISQWEAAGFLRFSDGPDIANIGHNRDGKKPLRVLHGNNR